MRKVLKKIKYANDYKTWEAKLGNKKHKKYIASFKFYKDVIFELLICQKGLCAYTEYRLIEKKDLRAIKSEFINGKYTGNRGDMPVDIEHFDSRLKEDYGWRWSNLFAVYSLINQKVKRREEMKLIKNKKSVHYIMKPDSSTYDPSKILAYETSQNIFIPNTILSIAEKQQVLEMINCLGLNNSFIKMKRIEYFNELDVRIRLGEKINPHQFMTGWKLRS